MFLAPCRSQRILKEFFPLFLVAKGRKIQHNGSIMLDDLIIYQKTYDFLLWLHPILNKFPQSQKFIMRQRIGNKELDLIHAIILSNEEYDKSASLKEMSIELDELRTLIRLAKDLRFLKLASRDLAGSFFCGQNNGGY